MEGLPEYQTMLHRDEKEEKVSNCKTRDRSLVTKVLKGGIVYSSS